MSAASTTISSVLAFNVDGRQPTSEHPFILDLRKTLLEHIDSQETVNNILQLVGTQVVASGFDTQLYHSWALLVEES